MKESLRELKNIDNIYVSATAVKPSYNLRIISVAANHVDACAHHIFSY
jgi:hypothetical protein